MTDYPKPSLTVDAVVISGEGKHMRLLVIERGKDPYKGSWALPGGFVDPYENPARAVLRELEEETGLVPPYLVSRSACARARGATPVVGPFRNPTSSTSPKKWLYSR